MFPRDSRGSIELKEGTGAPTAMCSCGEFLEIYKEDVTFRLQSPEAIDPDRTNPNAPFVAAVADSVGSSSPVVARVFIQGYEIIQSAVFRQTIDKAAVVQLLHEAKESLVVCQKVAQRIGSHVDRIIGDFRAHGVARDSGGRALNPFPQVPELDTEATMFLIHAKRAIQKICRLPSLFLPVKRKDSNFDKLLQTLLKTADTSIHLTDFVRNKAAGVRAIIDLRNYQEHPDEERRTVIKNFTVTPDGSIAPPLWNISGETPSPVRDEMLAVVDFLVQVAETMLIYLVMGAVEKRIPFVIQKVDKPDPRKPIRFRLSVDVTKMRIDTKKPE
jgi:hypothetical protein